VDHRFEVTGDSSGKYSFKILNLILTAREREMKECIQRSEICNIVIAVREITT
jgi:hypothetical protein